MKSLIFSDVKCGSYIVSGSFRKIDNILLDVDFDIVTKEIYTESPIVVVLNNEQTQELEYEFAKLIYDESIDYI